MKECRPPDFKRLQTCTCPEINLLLRLVKRDAAQVLQLRFADYQISHSICGLLNLEWEQEKQTTSKRAAKPGSKNMTCWIIPSFLLANNEDGTYEKVQVLGE